MPRVAVVNKTLVLTTTNGTKLLHMANSNGAHEIITGSFANITAVCNHLIQQQKPVLLACAGWKDRINIEDTLFAGAVIHSIKDRFDINCDSSKIATSLYEEAKENLFEYMKTKEATHYQRLSSFGLEEDIKHCLRSDTAPVVAKFSEGKLLAV